ncbi:MAG: VOC family protein [Candidatus Ranarchaeia archaeon]|jgi:predicted enzyme related to lactoylglutathione lyase
MSKGKGSPIPYKKKSIYFSYLIKNYDRAVKFYQDVFGFEKLWDQGEKVGWCEFALPVEGAKLGLNLLEKGEIKRGSGTLVFDVADLMLTKKYLESKGVKTTDIVDVPDMVSFFHMDDSEGNPIQFVADPRVKSKS